MCRPRDSHDLRLLDTGLSITPQPSALRWMHGVFGNSIAIAAFPRPHRSWFSNPRFARNIIRCPNGPFSCRRTPGAAAALLCVGSRRSAIMHRAALSGSGAQARRMGEKRTRCDARPCDDRGADEHDRGDQSRVWLCAARGGRGSEPGGNLGAQRRQLPGFRRANDGSGALPGDSQHNSCRATCTTNHWSAPVGRWSAAARPTRGFKWYLPGVGWVEFDPTNALVGGRNLIRVAVAQGPSGRASRRVLHRRGAGFPCVAGHRRGHRGIEECNR
jgi:hypothetical protein